jgi:hypothetical protein
MMNRRVRLRVRRSDGTAMTTFNLRLRAGANHKARLQDSRTHG